MHTQSHTKFLSIMIKTTQNRNKTKNKVSVLPPIGTVDLKISKVINFALSVTPLKVYYVSASNKLASHQYKLILLLFKYKHFVVV